MAGFIVRSAEFAGRLTVPGRIDKVFPLFSPLGERAWVPNWNPELLHPSDASSPWALGQIFRTRDDAREAVWIVTELDRDAHRVEYHRVEFRRYVARVRVICTPSADGSTEVSTSYAFVGLSNDGNDEIAAMTDQAYAVKMKSWEQWIRAHLAA